MKVYDVVHLVDPGAMTSVPVGRWAVTHRDVKEEVRLIADICICNTTIPGVDYAVEEHEETCPGRATEHRWGANTSELCTCKGEGA